MAIVNFIIINYCLYTHRIKRVTARWKKDEGKKRRGSGCHMYRKEVACLRTFALPFRARNGQQGSSYASTKPWRLHGVGKGLHEEVRGQPCGRRGAEEGRRREPLTVRLNMPAVLRLDKPREGIRIAGH